MCLNINCAAMFTSSSATRVQAATSNENQWKLEYMRVSGFHAQNAHVDMC